MLIFWLRVTFPVLMSAIASLLIGSHIGQSEGIGCFILLLLLIMVYRAQQLYKLLQWLKDPQLTKIPEGEGIWGSLFSYLYKTIKQYKHAQKELAEQLTFIEQAIAALPQGVVILNAYNRIEWMNPLAQAHFKLDEQRDHLQDITYLIRQPDFVQYLQKGDYAQPLMIRSARHENMQLLIKCINFSQDKRLVLTTDVTQKELLEKMRRSFVANVSHELRTPLTVINGYVENLQDMPDIEPAQTQFALQKIAEQAHRMNNLVKDLLVLSELEATRSPSQQDMPVDMNRLLDDVYHDGLQLSDGRHKLTLNSSSHVQVMGNEKELRSAFGNLLSNAVRYTPEGGQITLEWGVRQGRAVFCVQDTGIGIPAKHLSRLTERFYRVDDSRSRGTGGTGLGLAIVNSIVQRHQAELKIDSVEGRGSKFFITFPAKRVKSSA